MSQGTVGFDESSALDENLLQSTRDRWASPLAKIIVTIHALAGTTVVGWYYFIVPIFKREFERTNVVLTEAMRLVIIQSNLVVNYWYLSVIIAPAVLMIDFLVARWVVQEIGLKHGIVFGGLIAAIILVNMFFGIYVLG